MFRQRDMQVANSTNQVLLDKEKYFTEKVILERKKQFIEVYQMTIDEIKKELILQEKRTVIIEGYL